MSGDFPPRLGVQGFPLDCPSAVPAPLRPSSSITIGGAAKTAVEEPGPKSTTAPLGAIIKGIGMKLPERPAGELARASSTASRSMPCPRPSRMASMGLPRPEIEERGDCVTVRFRRKDASFVRQAGAGLTEQQDEVLALLRHSGAGLALREIRSLLDGQLSDSQLRRCLAALRAAGLAFATGHGRGARWKAT